MALTITVILIFIGIQTEKYFLVKRIEDIEQRVYLIEQNQQALLRFLKLPRRIL